MLKELADAGWGYSHVDIEVDTPKNIIKMILTNEDFSEIILTIVINLTNGDSVISTKLMHEFNNNKFYSWDNYVEENSFFPCAKEINEQAARLIKEA